MHYHESLRIKNEVSMIRKLIRVLSSIWIRTDCDWGRFRYNLHRWKSIQFVLKTANLKISNRLFMKSMKQNKSGNVVSNPEVAENSWNHNGNLELRFRFQKPLVILKLHCDRVENSSWHSTWEIAAIKQPKQPVTIVIMELSRRGMNWYSPTKVKLR